MRQHAIFEQQGHDPTRNNLDPSIPPGFQMANIGQDIGYVYPLTIQIVGSLDKADNRAGFTFEVCTGNSSLRFRQGFFGYVASSIFKIAMACLRAVTWAADNQYKQLKILTDSEELIQLLTSDRPLDIHVIWTVQQTHTLAYTTTIMPNG